MKLKTRIEKVIIACSLARDRKDGSGYLPDIIVFLEEMLKIMNSGGESRKLRKRRMAGLYRILSDDVVLLGSVLGKRLVGLMNTYVEKG